MNMLKSSHLISSHLISSYNYVLLKFRKVKNIFRENGFYGCVIVARKICNKILYRYYYTDRYWENDHMRRNFNFFRRTKKFEKPLYIIRRRDGIVGLFSYFITDIGAIAYAHENNMLPVIDMQNTPNAYLYENEIGKINAWEYYFKQPAGISVNEAKSCKKYYLSRDSIYFKRPNIKLNNDDLKYWRDIRRKYIKFTAPVIDGVNKLENKFKNKKVLGVLLRGTDYTSLRPKGHPIQPEPEQVILKAREVMKEKNFNAVYLATEDKNIMLKFKNYFGENLLLPEQDFINYDGKGYLINYSGERQNDKYLRGLEYLISCVYLSRLNGFITSQTSGSTGIAVLSDGFEYLHVFNLGVY